MLYLLVSVQASDLTLSIIDTPGFNDTEGVGQDACNIMSVRNFKENHSALKGCFPNVVLIIVQATDNRFMGEQSAFSKTLKAFSKHVPGIFDRRNPNVIVAISWACSLPDRNAEKWKRKLVEKGNKINEVLNKTLGLSAPVVWIENAFEEAELERRTDCTVLPDGTLQPKNLFLAITDLLAMNQDNLGIVTMKEFFAKNGKQVRFDVGYSTHAKDAKAEGLSSREMEIVRGLQEDAIVGTQLPEVTSKIYAYLDKHKATIAEVCVRS